MSFNVKVYKNTSFKDHRGYYWTSWKRSAIKKIIFRHDKFSLSKKNVLRGLHGDKKTWKMISCIYGKVFFVVVDMRKKSTTYLKHKQWILNYKKPVLILIPPYFANAHLCLSRECIFHYKLSYKGKYVDIKKQQSYRWNDPKLNIKWPIKRPILSKRDKLSKFL